jgi:hypothetical protein
MAAVLTVLNWKHHRLNLKLKLELFEQNAYLCGNFGGWGVRNSSKQGKTQFAVTISTYTLLQHTKPMVQHVMN